MGTVAIRKAQAACAQNFAPRQQATIEFTGRDHSPCTLVVTFNRSQVSIGRAFTPRSLYYCLFVPRIYIVVLRAHPVHGESHIQRNATGEVATTSSPLFTTNRTDLTSFCEGFTRHNLHILVTGTAPFFAIRKARAACTQSFTPWQQATIEFTCCDHSPRTPEMSGLSYFAIQIQS